MNDPKYDENPPPAPTKQFGTLPAEVYATMSGEESLRAMLAGKLPIPPLGEVLNFWPVEIGFGAVVLAGEPDARHLNPHGTVHGGWAASVLDTALGFATHSTLKAGEQFTTVDLSIKYLRPIIVGQTGPMHCTATIINRGRTLVLGEARLADRLGKLYANATSTCMVLAVKA